MKSNNGKLYIVATPIGNLKDITLRALEVLKSVDVIACEDTRVSKKLLNSYDIGNKTLISYYEPKEERIIPKIIELLKDGKDVALISDAGTPSISDPGYKLIKRSIEEGIEIIPIPGAFAGLSGLVASGLPTDKFIFIGFLPNKEGKKREILKKFGSLNSTVILYESPNRVLKTLNLIKELFPNSDVVIAKEITKLYERFIRGKIGDVIQELKENRDIIKGEFVILFFPNVEEKDISLEQIIEKANTLKKTGLKIKDISKILAKEFNLHKKDIYKILIKNLKD